jgi:hypothetical protein
MSIAPLYLQASIWLSQPLNHFPKFCLNLKHLRKLSKRPPSKPTQIVHSWNPIGAHGTRFFLGIFTPIAFDLHNQIQRI